MERICCVVRVQASPENGMKIITREITGNLNKLTFSYEIDKKYGIDGKRFKKVKDFLKPVTYLNNSSMMIEYHTFCFIEDIEKAIEILTPLVLDAIMYRKEGVDKLYNHMIEFLSNKDS